MKPKPLAARSRQIAGEGAMFTLEKALALEQSGRDMIHLEIGQPDFDTPAHVIEAGIAAIRAGKTKYGPAPGHPDLRRAIAAWINRTRRADIASADHILVTPGAKPVIMYTIFSLVEPGDEVILPAPGFPAYAATVPFAGGRPVYLPLRAGSNFRVDPDELRSLVTERTKLLILNAPGNPTGSLISPADLEAIADIVLEHNLWVLTDEIYAQLYYGDEPPVSIATLDSMAERTILADGFSKTYAMTGWRLGFGLFPAALIEPVTNMIINNHSCVPTFVQEAGVAALEGPQDALEEMRLAYRARRDLVVDTLNDIPGMRCSNPQGAFYAMPDISALGVDARQMVDRCLQAGVALLPGSDFGPFGETYLRISYANSAEMLRRGLARLRNVALAL